LRRDGVIEKVRIIAGGVRDEYTELVHIAGQAGDGTHDGGDTVGIESTDED
jgi:hypothetical protein